MDKLPDNALLSYSSIELMLTALDDPNTRLLLPNEATALKEAEDVIAVLTSFAAFDRLHQDGRRSTAAVIEILMRMAGSILNPSP